MRRSVSTVLLLVAAGIFAFVRSLLSGERENEREAARVSGRRSQRVNLKERIKTIVAFVGALGILGFLVSVSGVIPIKASSGHWAITEWFLNFSMARSVSTHSISIEVPPLDEPWMTLKGATHYEIGCAPCHGSPELQVPRITGAMTPQPPYLPPTISEWENKELFYIVKHGVKFTGMPAWATQQRDDEVWAMVAFLRLLPRLNAEEYRRLVSDPASARGEVASLSNLTIPAGTPRPVVESCARCHGADGRGRGLGAFPKLAGQRPDYLYASLQAFAREQRHSGIMEPIAAGLNPEEMRELARYYANLPPEQPSSSSLSPPDAASTIALGEAIAQRGIPGQRIPSCAACHGSIAVPRNPLYPELAGQYADYLVLQLMLFKNEDRGGTEYAHIMSRIAARLTPEQMRAVAMYYASLPPAPDRPAR